MRTFLLSIGFILMEDGSYYNNEIGLRIHIGKDTDGKPILKVPTPKGIINATIEELEDTIVSGGFGDF